MDSSLATLIILGLILLIGANLVILFILYKKFQAANDAPKNGLENSDSLKLILDQMNSFSDRLENKVGDINRSLGDNMHRQFSESKKIISEVTEKLTRLDETNKQVVGFADQLQNLQDILKNPKQRGILGEYYLETLLKNVMPPGSYQMQYPFPVDRGSRGGGEESGIVIVDAVVFVKDKIIPIDSKFSLENYNRLVAEKDPVERERLERAFKGDLKNRIDETSKYIQPAKGTMDFAFMFIPHEAIYYDLLVAEVGGMKVNTRDLIEYAFKEKHVLIVSPTSFLAFLQTVLQGLKALQIEETAKDIVARVDDLGKHLKSFEEYHKKLGNSLGTVVSHFNSSNREFRKIDKDVTRITGVTHDIETLALEKPEGDE